MLDPPRVEIYSKGMGRHMTVLHDPSAIISYASLLLLQLSELFMSSSNKLFIHYHSDNHPDIIRYADAKWEDIARLVVEANLNSTVAVRDAHIHVDSQVAVLAFRNLVVLGIIKPEQILFINEKGEECHLHQNGSFADSKLCPLISYQEKFLMNIISARTR